MNAAALWGAIDVVATLFWVLRVAAGIGAALVGWFLTGPVVRLLYRGAFHRPVPAWVMPWSRLGGAVLLGVLVFYYLPLGGSGGLGWGTGAGGGPGLGPGAGHAKTKDSEPVGAEKPTKTSKTAIESLDIELIGGTRYHDDGRFYLINRLEPVVTLEEVEDYFKKHKERLAEYVTIILTPKSVAAQHGAVLRLTTIIEKYERIAQVKNVNTGRAKDKD